MESARQGVRHLGFQWRLSVAAVGSDADGPRSIPAMARTARKIDALTVNRRVLAAEGATADREVKKVRTCENWPIVASA